MGQIATFERLHAPLAVRNSWGAVRASDDVVFLLLWSDRIERINGILAGRLSHHSKRNSGERLASFWLMAYEERLAHIYRIRQGRPCYLVVNRAKNKGAFTREVLDCDDEHVYVGGKLFEHDGETWIELGALIPIEDVAQPMTHA
jgi:hypothetical protein